MVWCVIYNCVVLCGGVVLDGYVVGFLVLVYLVFRNVGLVDEVVQQFRCVVGSVLFKMYVCGCVVVCEVCCEVVYVQYFFVGFGVCVYYGMFWIGVLCFECEMFFDWYDCVKVGFDVVVGMQVGNVVFDVVGQFFVCQYYVGLYGVVVNGWVFYVVQYGIKLWCFVLCGVGVLVVFVVVVWVFGCFVDVYEVGVFGVVVGYWMVFQIVKVVGKCDVLCVG